MAVRPGPSLVRRQLGAELRRLRERTDRTCGDVARELGWSESKLSRIETARTGISLDDVDRLVRVYALDDGIRDKLRTLARQGRQRPVRERPGRDLPDPYEAYIGYEAEAASIMTYEAQIVPGLLQTPEYAKAIMQPFGSLEDESAIDERVALRMSRQAVFVRTPAPDFIAVIDEAVLRRPMGGVDVMRRQLLRLIEVGGQPHTTIHVLPLAVGAHPALAGSFVVLRFEHDEPPLVYSEGLTGGVFRNRPKDLQSYVNSFEALREMALSPADSAGLVEAIARGDM